MCKGDQKMFSAHDLIGLPNQMNTSNTQAGTKAGKQGAGPFPGQGSEPNTFSNSLAQATQQGSRFQGSTATKPELGNGEDQDKGEILRVVLDALKADHPDASLELAEQGEMLQLIGALDANLLPAEMGQTTRTALERLNASNLEKGAAFRKQELFQTLAALKDIVSNGYLTQRGESSGKGPEAGQDLQPLLKPGFQILQPFRDGAQEATLLTRESRKEASDFNTQVLSQAGQESGQKPLTLLQRMQQLLHMAQAAKNPAGISKSGERGRDPGLSQGAVGTEGDSGVKDQPFVKGMGRMVNTARTAANAGEMSKPQEAELDPRLRRFLNALGAKTKNSVQSDTKQPDFTLTGLQEQLGKSDNIESLVRHFNAEMSSGKPQAQNESGPSTKDVPVQVQPSPDGAGKADQPGRHLQQGTVSFDRSLQEMENKVVSQVFVRLFSGVRQGSGNMIINMHPPELGRVKVRLVSEKGKLQVYLHSQNQQVVGILEKHLPTLQQSLEDQGVSLTDLQVSVDSEDQERPRFEDQGFGQGAGKENRSGSAEDDESVSLADQEQAWSRQAHGLSLRI